jgi:hypothetical protein
MCRAQGSAHSRAKHSMGNRALDRPRVARQDLGMSNAPVTIEFLANPFCLAGRDLEHLSNLCGRCKADLRLIDLWDLDDEDVAALPKHLATFIRERRTGRRPGSIYGDAFIAGRRFHLSGWSEQQVAEMEQWIRQCSEGAGR